MIDYDAMPVGTPLVCQSSNKRTEYRGTYFGREIHSYCYNRYPIIKIEDSKHHMCVSKNGECSGLWIEDSWDVSIAPKSANISELF